MDDLIEYQDDSDGSSNCQVGNEMRSVDIIYYQVGRDGLSSYQVGNGKRPGAGLRILPGEQCQKFILPSGQRDGID
jgi:hypothetical protein